MTREWSVSPVDSDAVERISRSLSIGGVLSSVLAGRGLSEPVEAFHFLHPALSRLHSPFLMRDMDRAVRRIRLAVERRETVAIFSDSDLDGLTSLTTVVTLLKKLAPELRIRVRYPRNGENYGLTAQVIGEFAAAGASLLITLDCGVRDIDEISLAKGKGLDVIVCDHHEPGEGLPEALIINPMRADCPYPFKDLAGVGVAFKLCHAVLLSYLPSYGRTFLLVSGEEGSFSAASVVNGMVTRRWNGLDGAALTEASQGADFIAVYRCPVAQERLAALCPGPRVYDLAGEVRAILKGKGVDLSDVKVMEEFSICPEVARDGIEFTLAVFNEIQRRKSPKIIDFNRSVMGLVALGSIADIVPLSGENRILVRHGIESLDNTGHAGLSMLINGRPVNSRLIGWHMAPVLNAPGRMGKTDYTAEFLLQGEEKDMEEKGRLENDIRGLMEEINRLNAMRKSIVAEHCERIMERIGCGDMDVSGPLVFAVVEAPDGVTGLIANRITDAVNKPVVVVSRQEGQMFLKGSGRVRGAMDFFSRVEPLSHLFEKIGGHAHAFGFTVRQDCLEAVRDALVDAVSGGELEPRAIEVDGVLDVVEITPVLVEDLKVVEPCGSGNEEPVFLTRDAAIRSFTRIGADKRHGKYLFRDNHELEALGWGMGDRMESIAASGRAHIVYRLENSTYNGRTSPRMIILDIAPGSPTGR